MENEKEHQAEQAFAALLESIRDVQRQLQFMIDAVVEMQETWPMPPAGWEQFVRDFDSYICEEGGPVFRSCRECNEAHHYLKDVTCLYYCLLCDRYWIFGKYLDSFETKEALDEFLRAQLAPTVPDDK